MKTHKKLQYNLTYFILFLMLVFSTLVFSRVESTAAMTSPPIENSKIRSDALPPNSKIFAPQKSPEVSPEKHQQVKLSPTKNTLPIKKANNIKHHKGLFRFLKGMFGVLLSAIVIFGGLKLYNFFILKNNSTLDNKKNKNSLESPKTFKETINSFLDKTDT